MLKSELIIPSRFLIAQDEERRETEETIEEKRKSILFIPLAPSPSLSPIKRKKEKKGRQKERKKDRKKERERERETERDRERERERGRNEGRIDGRNE